MMKNPSAALIIIGSEVLSGRTLDINTQYIAKKLSEHGIDLLETRTIPDSKKVIIDAILSLRDQYDYIFTTGGIGPTHDDITSESVAEAFGVAYERNDEAYKIIRDSYLQRGQELNPAREKMAYLPRGSSLIYNKISAAPGFIINNVYVMAGVPHIMQAMLESIMPDLRRGRVIQSLNIDVMIGESLIAAELSDLQNKYLDVEMGSYPFEKDGKHGTSLVLRSNQLDKLKKAYEELETIVQGKLRLI